MKEKWVESIKMKKTKVLAALLGSALLMATGCNSQNSQVKQETLNLSECCVTLGRLSLFSVKSISLQHYFICIVE